MRPRSSLVCCAKIQGIFLCVVCNLVLYWCWDIYAESALKCHLFYRRTNMITVCSSFSWFVYLDMWVVFSSFSLFPRKVARRDTAVCSWDARLSVGFILIIQSIRHFTVSINHRSHFLFLLRIFRLSRCKTMRIVGGNGGKNMWFIRT